MRRIFKSFLLLAVLSLVFTTSAFAKGDHVKKSLVALGDSIPYGYNLGDNNNAPSEDAFPFIIGDEADLQVFDLAVPGLKADGMLAKLKTDVNFRNAVKQANYVSLNIGSNDLLAALKLAVLASGGNPQKLNAYVLQYLNSSNLYNNLYANIAEIRKLTDAPIVVYNYYNPFQVYDPFHYVANGVLPMINIQTKILVDVANAQFNNVVMADAYTAFGENQAIYVIQKDIHPTEAGHKVLAKIGLEALKLNNK